jgi:hypothetical protein
MSHEVALSVPDDCLVVFIDDVGHEALLADQQVYGLGGCAVLGRDLDAIIRTPSREIRRQVTGSPDTPLHASSFPKKHAAAVGQFFGTQLFFRLGAIITIKTRLSSELGGPVPTIAAVLKERIREAVSHTPAKSVTVVFEASERADRLIEDAFQGFGLAEGTTQIPVECCFMRKEHGEPGLEVADFAMHAVQGQCVTSI